MNQLRGLLLDGRDHFGVAMAGRNHGNARGEVEKLVAVHIFHADAAAALGHQRIRARITGRDEPCIRFDGSLCLGSRQSSNELGSVLRMQFLLGHLGCLLGVYGCAAAARWRMERRYESLRFGDHSTSSWDRKGPERTARAFGGPILIAAEKG